MEFLVIATAIVAGIVQGVTGFGAGIVLMMVLPSYFALAQSAGISTAICLMLSCTMVYTYRQYISFKTIVRPALFYIVICSISIYFSTMVDQLLMKKLFGVFLIILACYYLFIDKGERKKLSLPISILCIVASAICDGLFGIGGPLMVLYFLSQTHNTHQYLGTIQTFFFINGIYNTCFRVFNGIITVNHLFYIGIGMIGILVGGLLARKIVDTLNGQFIRKLTYIMIGISGIMNII